LIYRRSPSPPRSNINSAYYRTPQASSASKYGGGHYATSAVGSVSASAIYGNSANSSGTGHPYQSESDRSKPVYLAQSVVTAPPRSSYSTSLAVAAAERDRAAAVAQQRAAIAASAAPPPAAHAHASSAASTFRSGSILSGYPRTLAYTVQSNPPSAAQSPRLIQAPAGQQQANGTIRYYTQREV
jgi:hypothetical protein